MTYTGKFPSEDKEKAYLKELTTATTNPNIPQSAAGNLDEGADLWVEKSMNPLEAQVIIGALPEALPILKACRNAVSVTLARASINNSPVNDSGAAAAVAAAVMDLIKGEVGTAYSQLEAEINKLKSGLELGEIARKNGMTIDSLQRALTRYHGRFKRWLLPFLFGATFGTGATVILPHAKNRLEKPSEKTVGHVSYKKTTETDGKKPPKTVFIRHFAPTDGELPRKCETIPTSGAEKRLGEMKTFCVVKGTEDTPPCNAWHKPVDQEVKDASGILTDRSVGIPCIQKQ